MSYPPPPGLRSPSSLAKPSTPPAYPALPPRLPPTLGSSTSLAPTVSSPAPGTRGYRAIPSDGDPHPTTFPYGIPFQPRSVMTPNQPLHSKNPTVSVAPAPLSSFPIPPMNRALGSNQMQYSHPTHPGPRFEDHVNTAAIHIQNPFPLPGLDGVSRNAAQGQDITDPEMEAQIAQWQSAYTGKDSHIVSTSRGYGGNKWLEGSTSSTGANSAALGLRPDNHGASRLSGSLVAITNTDSGVAEVVTGADGKQKTVVRQGGGQTWQDPSLLEWDPAHFRLFVGNLAGEVTDDSLLKAFCKYPSVEKARVVRDKRTTKSKGYGFVSFADGDEYFQAARDMQGKYIGSHPVLLRKSTTEIRPTVSRTNKQRLKRGKGGNVSGALGGINSDGVQKKHAKVKNGLRILG